ncbi:hypothetical protein Efla_005715 [Eimeria flavescens]
MLPRQCGGAQLLTGKSATIEALWQWGGSCEAAELWLPPVVIQETRRDSCGVAAARRVGNIFAAPFSAFNMHGWRTGATPFEALTALEVSDKRVHCDVVRLPLCSQYAGGAFDLRHSFSANEIRLLRLPRNRLRP